MVNLRNLFTTSSWIELLLLILASIFSVALVGFALGWITMLLWNWLVPTIFGLKAITFWQAIGMLILSKLLLSGRNININKKEQNSNSNK